MDASQPVQVVQTQLETFRKMYETIAEYLIKNGLEALYGLLIFFIGYKVAGWVGRMIEDFLKKRHLDLALSKLLAAIVRIIIIVFAAMIMLEKFGITISPIIAAVSAAVFGASFAIQAPLANYAAGMSIILSHPFKIGDTVTIKDYSGVVEDIRLPFTVLATATGEKVTIPNKQIVGEVLINSYENKMADVCVGISYQSDPELAIRVIKDALKTFPGIVANPEPVIGIDSFGDSSINITVKYWTATKSLGSKRGDVNLAIYRALQKAKIVIPYPQREIRMLTN